MKINNKSYKNIIIYYIGHISIDGYIEGSNGNKYLTLLSTDENKDTLKKYTELWDKIKDLIRSITNTSGDYDEKYIKIKILKLHYLIIVVGSVF